MLALIELGVLALIGVGGAVVFKHSKTEKPAGDIWTPCPCGHEASWHETYNGKNGGCRQLVDGVVCTCPRTRREVA